jgi:hypothetical protein
MKIVGEIPHPSCKITIFSWNNKYIVKFERGPLEQTFKVSEYDLSGEENFKELVSTESFIEKVLRRFDEMDADWEEIVADDF